MLLFLPLLSMVLLAAAVAAKTPPTAALSALLHGGSAFRTDVHFAPIIPLGVMVFYPALRAAELLAALVAGRLKLFPTPLAFVLCSHSLYPPFFFIPPSLYRLLLFLRRFLSILRLLLRLLSHFRNPGFRASKNRATARFFERISFLYPQDGRSDRIRTCGLNIPNVARYQLRHTPTAFLLYMINTGVSTDSGGKILRKRKFILKKDLQNTRGCGNISRYDCQMGIYTLICVEAGGCGP